MRGTLLLDEHDLAGTVAEKSGERIFRRHVTFDNPLSAIPSIGYDVFAIDVDGRARYSRKPVDIDREGFVWEIRVREGCAIKAMGIEWWTTPGLEHRDASEDEAELLAALAEHVSEVAAQRLASSPVAGSA